MLCTYEIFYVHFLSKGMQTMKAVVLGEALQVSIKTMSVLGASCIKL